MENTDSGTLKFSNPAVKEETKHTPLLTVDSINTQLIEMWDAISTLDGEDKMFAEKQANEVTERLWKQYHEQEEARNMAPQLLKENQELKAEIERLKIAKVYEAVIKGILKKPGIVPQICANEIKKNEELKEQNGYLESVRTTQAKELTRLQAINAELLEALEAAYKAMSDSEDADGFDMKVFSKIESAINKAKL